MNSGLTKSSVASAHRPAHLLYNADTADITPFADCKRSCKDAVSKAALFADRQTRGWDSRVRALSLTSYLQQRHFRIAGLP